MLTEIFGEERARELMLNRLLILTDDEYEKFTAAANLLEEHDTAMVGYIRIYELDGKLFAEEESNKGDFILRPMNDQNEVKAFVDDRLNTYERMWDGCGACKVDYYDPFTLELKIGNTEDR